MTKLRPPTILSSIVLALVAGMALPGIAATPEGAFGDPTAPLPERVTAAEQAEGQGYQMMSTEDVKVYGGGWGHGIGMSQWGAQALAEQGQSYTQILSHFYDTAQFGRTTDKPDGTIVQHANPVQVGIGPSKTAATFTPLGGPVDVCLNTACRTAQPGETWHVVRQNGVCYLKKGDIDTEWMPCADPASGAHGQQFATITWSNQPNTRVQMTSWGRTYARGSISFVTAPGGLFHVRAALHLDEYLYGLGEVPNTWGSEALKAQVVAARTFALYRIRSVVLTQPGGLLTECSCHLRATTADQAYRGWEPNAGSAMTEGDPNHGQKWKGAVDATSGEAMWHSFSGGPNGGKDRALEAYYFSSTGDSTENNKDRWGGTQYPYLKSASDPGATSWTKGFSYAEFAASLGFHSVTWVEIEGRYDSGRPIRLVVTGKINGITTVKEFTSLQFDAALGLRAPWVDRIEGLLHHDADRVVLHNRNTGEWTYQKPGGLFSTIYFGNPGDIPFMGDWDGDGIDTPGLYRQSDGFVYLRNSNTQGNADISFYFGNPGDIPIVGDFDGDGRDSVSIYRPSQARFYIINKLGQDGGGLGAADYSFIFGNPGDSPFVGDWDGDGRDTPGLRRSSDGFVYLRNSNTQGNADVSFFYGDAGDRVFAGDWNGDGRDSVGLYRPSNGVVYLRNALSTGSADFSFQMGGSSHRPVSGWGWN